MIEKGAKKFALVGGDYSKKAQDDVLQGLTKVLNQHHLEYYIEANDGLYGSLNFKVRGVEALRQYGMKDPDVLEIYPAMTFPKTRKESDSFGKCRY